MSEELFSAAAREKRSKKWESIRTALPQELHAGSVWILIDLLFEIVKDGHYEELFEADMEAFEERVDLLCQLIDVKAPRPRIESQLDVIEQEAERLMQLVLACQDFGYTKPLW